MDCLGCSAAPTVFNAGASEYIKMGAA
eukprot:COSAG01_NODE_64048_length_278_cov_0.564246_1_plen_26_part_10